MDERRAHQVLAEVDRICRGATDGVGLQRQVAEVLPRAVPFDRWCAMTFDPTTALPTGGFHAEGLPFSLLPRLLELEYGPEPDVGRLADIARSPRPVAVLSDVTADPARSGRFRDVLRPAGLPHELRLVHRDGRAPWGALLLFRGTDAPDFSVDEATFLEAVAPRVAAALRRVQLLTSAGPSGDDAPGVVLLSVTESAVSITAGSPAAVRRLGDIEDGDLDGVPVAVASLARTALARPGPARCRLRSRSGHWLTLHGERLSASTVSLVVEPSRPADIATLLGDAYRLTARETEVVGLIARGCSNADIARELRVSPWTVADHIKNIFDKTGVRSRAELTSRLFFDHYLPRLGP